MKMTTDIHAWRSEICAQLIRTGKTDIEDVIKDATRLETYVFGSTKTADIKTQKLKLLTLQKLKRLKKPKQKRLKN